MYLYDFLGGADEAIVDRFKGGFVYGFNRQSLSVTIPYSKLCSSQKIKTNDISRVCFTFTDIRSSIAPWKHPLPTMSLWWFFDFSKYYNMSANDKRHAILDALHSASTRVADELGWKREPFDTAYRTIKEANCEFSGLSKRKWFSPDRKHRVSLSYSFKLEGLELAAVLFKSRSSVEIERVSLGTFLHDLDWVSAYLSQGQWNDNIESTGRPHRGATWRRGWLIDAPPPRYGNSRTHSDSAIRIA